MGKWKMNMREMVCGAITIQLLIALSLAGKAVAQPDTTGRSVDSPRQALDLAWAYTGFEEITALIEREDYTNVQVIILRDSTIPFLTDQVYDRPVWQIFVDNVYLDMPGCPSEEEAKWNPKEFYVLIDSTAGFFIKAYTKYLGAYDPSLGSDPPADKAERQLRGREFHGFSQILPNLTMNEALAAAAPSCPLQSKELTVYLVRQNYRGTSKLLWNIFGRGFPPSKFLHGPSLNFRWTIVDDEMGRFLMFGTSPSPVWEVK